MTTYRIVIEPVSPGMHENDSLRFGDGQYLTRPPGPRPFVLAATDAQIVGIQGYLVAIKGAADTSAIETAVAAVAT